MQKRTKTNFIVVHCSASGPNTDIGAKEIDIEHRKNGWAKIGYHFVIRRNGILEVGREIDEVGAHAYGVNQESIGICLVGGINIHGKPEANFTFAQYEKLSEILENLELKYSGVKIIGHRDVPNTKKDCPCFDVQSWYSKYKEHSEKAFK